MKSRRMFIDDKEIVQTFWDANQKAMYVVTEDKKKIALTDQEDDWLNDACDAFLEDPSQPFEYNRFKISY